jgi:hypothetical protein
MCAGCTRRRKRSSRVDFYDQRGLAGTRAAGLVLLRQEPAGKWAAATYALTPAAPTDPIGHRTHRTDGPKSAPPVAPVSPMGAMPNRVDGGAVPPGTAAEI